MSKLITTGIRTGIAPTGRPAAVWRSPAVLEMIASLDENQNQWGFVAFDGEEPRATAEASQGPLYRLASGYHGFGTVRTSVVPAARIPNYNGDESDFMVVVAFKQQLKELTASK